MTRALTLWLVLASVPAMAAKPIVLIMDFAGPHARTTRTHFGNQVCHQLRCQKAGRDGDKVAADVIIAGSITPTARGDLLVIDMVSAADGQTATRTYKLNKRGMLLAPGSVAAQVMRSVQHLIPRPKLKVASRHPMRG